MKTKATKKIPRPFRKLSAPKKIKAKSKPLPGITVSDLQLQQAKMRIQPKKRARPPVNPFAINPNAHPSSVRPADKSGLAMDEDISLNNTIAWAGLETQNALFDQGLTFLGYPYLAELAQRPEYRHISETIATEMTREWIEFQSKNKDDDKTDKITQIKDEMIKLGVQDVFRRCAEKDGFFGRSHLYLDFGIKVDDAVGSPELASSIGTGNPDDEISKAKIKTDSLCSLKVIEPMWCYPTSYNARTPLSDHWYLPQCWLVQGTEVHATRLLRFVGREVPDMLKPAYSFGGLSLSQMAKPYVDNWLRTRDAVGDIVHSFVVYVLSTNLGTVLQSDTLINRLDLFNLTRDNKGVMAVDKETEEFANVVTSLSGLHELQSAALEQICAITKIPLVKFTGISPSGLNATNESEMRCFYDWIKAYQELLFRPNLTTVINFIQLSLFGEVDSDLVFVFKDLWSLDDEQEASVQKQEAETASIYVNDGVLHPEEVRARLANDPDAPYHDIEVDDVPEQMDEQDLMGQEHEFGQEDMELQHEHSKETAEEAHGRAKEMLKLQPKPVPGKPAAGKAKKK